MDLVMTTQFKKSGEFVITNDGAFAIRPEKYVDFVSFTQRDSIGLYIRDGLQLVDSPLKRLIDIGFIVSDGKLHTITRRIDGLDESAKYNRYTFFRPLTDKRKYLGYRQPVDDDQVVNENDCLKFAESLSVASNTLKKTVFTKLLRSNSSPCVYQAKDVPLLFGESDAKNRKMLTKIKTTKHKAFPSAGESYAIVRKELVLGSAPYHIAYVLYSNNGLNITLEANADDGAEYYPRFGFYDAKKTFHKLFVDMYENGTTIVLQSRPVEDFLNEFKAETNKTRKKRP
jgi:hypothetical protein